MFLQVCVILFTGGGVPDQVHPARARYPPSRDQVQPPGQVPPGPGTPPGQVHPPGTRYTPRTRYTPWARYSPGQVHPPGPGTPPRDQGDTVYARAVRIILECILVFNCVCL